MRSALLSTVLTSLALLASCGAPAADTLTVEPELGSTSVAVGQAFDLTVHVTNASGIHLSGVRVTVVAALPSWNQLQPEVTAIEESLGHYGVPITLPAAGNWELRVSAKRGSAHGSTTLPVTAQ